jgi:hypothetical protein
MQHRPTTIRGAHTMTSPKSREDEIRARLERATPGHWYTELHGIMDEYRSRTIVITGESEQDDADAELIANAPADLAYLLDALEMAEAKIAELGERTP